ncbi:MAG TPA: acireductone dioxygenase [Pseudomonadales bacterium]|nr:acireductone dioxygenase [Pseudomonadales bacterium]
MSYLKIFPEKMPDQILEHSGTPEKIAALLTEIGVRFEQWQPAASIKAGDEPSVVLDAYRSDVSRIVSQEGFVTVDVISLDSSNPNKDTLRQKFLSEHIHTEDEVRFFVEGQGLFYLHVADKVYSVLCVKGDLLSVPANTPHWFDLGPEPELVAIRFFNNPDGWIAHYTGNDIAESFPKLDG